MAFDNLGAFAQAGKDGGKASKNPLQYGAENVLDLFTQDRQNAAKLAQTAALFKAEKNYEYATDPTKIRATKDQEAMGNGGAAGSAPVAGSSPPSTSRAKPGGGNMIQKSAEGYGGQKFENPEVGAIEQQMKDRMEQDASFSALSSMISTHFGALKAYHDAIGEGGALPSATAKMATFGGDPYVSAVSAQLHTANESLAQRIAKEINPGGIGRILAATRGQVGSPDMPETANVTANIQLKKDFYGLKKAYDMASISDPLDSVLFNPDGTKKDFNNLTDKEAQFLNSQKDKVMSPEESAYLDKMGIDEYKNMKASSVQNPRTGETYQGPSRSAQAMAPFGKALAGIPGLSSFMGNNAGFPESSKTPWNEVTEQAKLQKLVANDPGNKDKYLQRFNQRKREALGNGQ